MQLKILAIVLLILTGGSCGSKKTETKSQSSTPPPVMVDVIVAYPESIANSIEASGTTIAGEYVELRPEVSGRIVYLNVPEGRTVSRGAVIARVNAADLRAQLQKARIQLSLARKTEQRFKQLIAVNGMNQSDYDIALNQVNSLQADISLIYAQLNKTVIRAPFTGVVGLRQISPGAYVTPQTVIATLQQLNRVKVDFTLPQEYANLIRLNKAVMVDFGGDQKRRGIIIALEPQVNINTRNLKVRAVLENGIVQPGAFAKVYIDAGSAKNNVVIPTNAIIPDAKNKKVVLVKNGKAHFVSVETGLRQESNVEIVSGINEGDTVVVSGVLFARPNSNLKIGKVRTLNELGKQ